LANILSEYGALEEDAIKFYARQILEGLGFLHEQKIKHLDLKCSNILTNNDDADINIKLCDFGSAREFKKGSNQVSSSFTSLQAQIVGSVQWMAPEVIAEEGSGSKSDIWSLGCTIVEMFVGGNPWGEKLDDQNLYLAQQTIIHSNELPIIPENRTVSAECEDFIKKCLTRDYNQRPSAAELLQHAWITCD
jgi:serine/threonine protein kinase